MYCSAAALRKPTEARKRNIFRAAAAATSAAAAAATAAAAAITVAPTSTPTFSGVDGSVDN